MSQFIQLCFGHGNPLSVLSRFGTIGRAAMTLLSCLIEGCTEDVIRPTTDVAPRAGGVGKECLKAVLACVLRVLAMFWERLLTGSRCTEKCDSRWDWEEGVSKKLPRGAACEGWT